MKLILILFVLTNGFLFFKNIQKGKKIDILSFFFASLSFGFLFYGLFTLGLSIISEFTVFNIILLQGVFLVINLYFLWKKKLFSKFSFRVNVISLIYLLIVIWAVSKPSEPILDERDNGMYAMTAAAIVENKGLVWKWKLNNPVYNPEKSYVLHDTYPLLSHENSYTNNGFDFFPAVLSIGYILKGWDGIFYMYSVLGFILGIGIFLLTKWILEKELYAFFVSIAAILSGPNLNIIKAGLSELLFSVILFSYIFILLDIIHIRSRYKWVVSTFLILGIFFTHPSGYLVLLPTGFWVAFQSNKVLYILSYTFVFALANIKAYFFDYQYIFLSTNLYVLYSYPIFIVVSLLNANMFYFRKIAKSFIYILILFFLGFAFSRFYFPIAQLLDLKLKYNFFDYNNFSDFYLYVPVGFFILSLLGIYYYCIQANYKKIYFILIFLLFSILFLLTSNGSSNFQYFVSRRFSGIIATGFVIFSALGFYSIAKNIKTNWEKNLIVYSFSFLFILNSVSNSFYLIHFQEYKGVGKLVYNIANLFSEDIPIFTNGKWASILNYAYQKKVVPLEDLNLSSIDHFLLDKPIDKFYILVPSKGEHSRIFVENYILSNNMSSYKILKKIDLPIDLHGIEQLQNAVPRKAVVHKYHLAYFLLERDNVKN